MASSCSWSLFIALPLYAAAFWSRAPSALRLFAAISGVVERETPLALTTFAAPPALDMDAVAGGGASSTRTGEPCQLLRVGHRERGGVGPLGADRELLLLGDAGPVPEPRGGNLGVHQLYIHVVVHVAHQRQDLGQELRRGLLRVRHELVPVLANLHRVLMFVGDPSVVEHGHLIEQRVVLVDVLGCELGGVLLLGHILQHALHRVLLRDDCVELLLEELAL